MYSPLKSSNWTGLSLDDTNALKGIALLLLLCHHLFYIQNGKYDDIKIFNQYNLIQEFAIACKVCVAIFVFLSGYGLAKKYNNIKLDVKGFYVTRFVKLLLNFWFIWLLFVPIGILFFGRSLEQVYQHHIWLKAFIDFIGLAYSFGYYGMNPTWWFMSCIIILYLLFPFLFKYKKMRFVFLLCSIGIIFCPLFVLNPIKYYLTSFLLGILFAQSQLFDRILSLQNAFAKISMSIFCLIFFLIRNFLPYPLLFDSLLAILLVITCKLFIKSGIAFRCLIFLGKHSLNIFLFHTFIYYYYFCNIIYHSRNPLMIYITMLVLCLMISVVIEYLKKMLLFKSLSDTLVKCLK